MRIKRVFWRFCPFCPKKRTVASHHRAQAPGPAGPGLREVVASGCRGSGSLAGRLARPGGRNRPTWLGGTTSQAEALTSKPGPNGPGLREGPVDPPGGQKDPFWPFCGPAGGRAPLETKPFPKKPG